MTTNRLDQIEARLDAASPAPWRADGLAGTLSGPMGDVAHVNMWREADAQLIAHAPVDLVDLVAFVRGVEARHVPLVNDKRNGWRGEPFTECSACGGSQPWPCFDRQALDRLNGGV